MQKRIFLDANVIFTAAHNPQGKAALLFELFGDGHWKLITSQLAWKEARRNLTIKFPESISRLKKLHQDLEILANSGPRPCPIEEATYIWSKLPLYHKDPFDRMLICQSIYHAFYLLTPDPLISQYPLGNVW